MLYKYYDIIKKKHLNFISNHQIEIPASFSPRKINHHIKRVNIFLSASPTPSSGGLRYRAGPNETRAYTVSIIVSIYTRVLSRFRFFPAKYKKRWPPRAAEICLLIIFVFVPAKSLSIMVGNVIFFVQLLSRNFMMSYTFVGRIFDV